MLDLICNKIERHDDTIERKKLTIRLAMFEQGSCGGAIIAISTGGYTVVRSCRESLNDQAVGNALYG
jgi:hypothetical protein